MLSWFDCVKPRLWLAHINWLEFTASSLYVYIQWGFWSNYPAFDTASTFVDSVGVVVDDVHQRLFWLWHNEFTTLFQRRRTFFSELSSSRIFGLGVRTFSSPDDLLTLLLLLWLMLLLLWLRLLSSNELLVCRTIGIFDFTVVTLSIMSPVLGSSPSRDASLTNWMKARVNRCRSKPRCRRPRWCRPSSCHRPQWTTKNGVIGELFSPFLIFSSQQRTAASKRLSNVWGKNWL